MDSHDSHIAYPAKSHFRADRADIAALALILILGLAVRLFAWHQTSIMNSDGTVYIQQARAIYFGLWDAVTSCTIRYPYLNTFFIAAFYAVFGDWITAATAVSVFFGTLALIPLFYLARNFFPREIAFLIALIHAVNPMLVDGSVDIVRDPLHWLLILLGLYLLTRWKGQTTAGLLLSSCAFILATWTRVESVVFILIAPVYLWLDGQERPLQRIAAFLSPIAVLLLAGIGGQWLIHPERIDTYRLAEIPARLTLAFSQYEHLRSTLRVMTLLPPPGLSPEFLNNLQSNVWFLGFGVIVQNALETFFYPFFLVYLVGLGHIRQEIGRDRRVLCFCLLVPAAFFLLYFYVFINWEMENRWLALALFPSFLFLGFGLERVIAWMQAKFNLKKGMALALIALLALAITLPKDMKPRGEDKVVYREIGESIAAREGNAKKIEIMTVGAASRWILFFANLHFRGAPCPDEFYDYLGWIGHDYGAFVEAMKKRGMKYLVWEERNWPAGSFDFIHSPHERDFVRLGAWSHPDTGRIILFRLR
ncbi:MAG: glycosyltransferase family 39 protein [Deltaproteobacteria bacterium]|nr:glycosyltransferase family 39 protein [Deltaproteobacteria bacterium]